MTNKIVKELFDNLERSNKEFMKAQGMSDEYEVETEEDLLELDHPGVGEQKSRVFFRHQRGAWKNPVPSLTEVVQKPLADLRCCHPRIGH